MANYTNRYKLQKPLQEEFYDVQVQNDNMDKMEAALVAHDTALDEQEKALKRKADLDGSGRIPVDQLPDGFGNIGAAGGAAVDLVVTEGFTIPATGWVTGGDSHATWRYRLDIPCGDATARHVPLLALDRASQGTASAAGLCPTVEALDGSIRLYATAIPSAVITGTLTLMAQKDGTAPPTITIPATGWAASGFTLEHWRYRLDIPCGGATARHVPLLALDRASQGTASAAGLCPTVEALDGSIRLYAQAVPAAAMRGTLLLLSQTGGGAAVGGGQTLPTASRTTLGGIRASDTLQVDEHGIAHAVWGEEGIASDGDVADALNDIFGQAP